MSKVLVYDDDKDILEVISLILNEYHEVTSRTNAEHLQYDILEVQPDIVIVDIRLGLHNGIEICRQLKANPITSKIKLILTSAAIVDMEQILNVSDGYLEKPFEIDRLISLVAGI